MEKLLKKIGSWLFLVGILVAVIVGLIVGAEWMEANSYVIGLLAVLGFVVGLLSFFAMGSITHEKVPTFLIGALTLVLIGALSSTWSFGEWQGLAPYLTGITQYLAIFAAPAAGILAIRAIWDAGKTKEIERVIPKMPK